MRRATCPFCIASITLTIPPVERTPDRVRVPAPARVVRLPIPIVRRCTKAAIHRVRALARVLARARAAIRPPTPAAPPPDSDRPVLHSERRQLSIRKHVRRQHILRRLQSSEVEKEKERRRRGLRGRHCQRRRSEPSAPVPGKFAGYGAPVVPTLFGLPIDMHQTVAVSDAIDRPEHPWNYIWANPDDEDKMKDCYGGSCAERAGAQSASRS